MTLTKGSLEEYIDNNSPSECMSSFLKEGGEPPLTPHNDGDSSLRDEGGDSSPRYKDGNDRFNTWMIISHRFTCDDSCPYVEICPMMLEGSKKKLCLLQRDEKAFNSFYNLYLGHYEGLKSELTNVAFEIMKSCTTNEERLTYFNALNKIMSSCYSPEKNQKDDFISEINLNIVPLDGSK